MSRRLEDKVALVTGAARGQGRSHCIRLAEEGADIIAIDVCSPNETVASFPLATDAELDETAAAVQRLDRRVLARQVDVRNLEDLEAVVAEGIEKLGRLDTVVANAAIVEWGKSWEFTEKQWRDIIDVNLNGVWNTARATVPALIEQDLGGSLVFTSSLAGSKGIANVAPYVTAKHGIIGLMRCMAVELGPHRIRVNTVNPTNVDTPMIQHPTMWSYAVPDTANPSTEQIESALATMNAIPVPWIDPVDVSNAVVFLASDEARFITGVSLPVDAGAAVK
ncbi:mycofactocin-coupled SDR family oxidoreductase [Rhodococcus sp. 14C212]|uniref:mycofactocin-coupled SDR family oxidoreductase n=1 Tax=Rhodococcus sp. 14C212 TaxID=2711209 RepID=UPI0013ED170E|nr:mycofactocin-coupled SDR family oxidoreductase [Rhodococcus sp. 14C212]NGP08479.1 mycofactocin-coupled SDR family oxidoreductase [Rhodococcus sp. 14C212]